MFKKIVLVLALLLISLQVFASERQIPLMFGYQGALIDEGGNPLPDGPTDMKFRILDSVGNVLYEESQNLDMIKGEIFAIVGNGLSPINGSPMGGIPLEVFDPVDTKYLQVLVDGQMPFDKLEIVTAPYALWADTALHMPDGAITSAMIGKGVITKDHLNAELISAIFPGGIPKDMLPSDTMYGNEIQDTGGASKIGVKSSFIYSTSSTVQGVLKDLDVAIKKRSEEFVWAKNDYGTKITNETTARQSADTTETNTRIAADTALQGNITNETTARGAADTAETNTRIMADNAEAAARASGDSSVQTNLDTHAGATTAHGSNGAIVGANDLATKVSKSGDSVTGSLSMRTAAGVETILINGQSGGISAKNVYANVSATNVGATKVTTNEVREPVGNKRLTPFAYGTIQNSSGCLFTKADAYNVANADYEGIANSCTVFFSTPPVDDKYIVILTSGNEALLLSKDKSVNSFRISGNLAFVADFIVFDNN